MVNFGHLVPSSVLWIKASFIVKIQSKHHTMGCCNRRNFYQLLSSWLLNLRHTQHLRCQTGCLLCQAMPINFKNGHELLRVFKQASSSRVWDASFHWVTLQQLTSADRLTLLLHPLMMDGRTWDKVSFLDHWRSRHFPLAHIVIERLVHGPHEDFLATWFPYTAF